jgi:16S rRNA (guanine527-N7)-methyltransferase
VAQTNSEDLKLSRMTDNQIELFRNALSQSLTSFDIPPLAALQFEQLVTHYEMLSRWNRRINLTRIVEPAEAARLHYGESLFGGRFIQNARTVLDIGSGAGFPGIVLATLRPDVHITALEVNQKKAIFLNEAGDGMKLKNFKVVRARLEEIDWSGYDLLTSRALDRAEEMIQPVVTCLGTRQRLMLYSTRDLAVKLADVPGKNKRVEIHPIPQSESRIIAIFSTSR